MKKIVCLIALMMLLKPVLPVMEYVYNYDYITKELCVNKENLLLGCNGKCYLMKELAKASESEKPISSDKKHTLIETTDLFLVSLASYEFSVFQNPRSFSINAAYANLYSHLNTNSAFHPPTAIS